SIIDNNPSGDDLIANTAIFNAPNGIGTAANPVEVNVAMLEAAGGTGGVFLANDGPALQIGGISSLVGVQATTGAIAISALGPLVVVENVSTAGNITLTSLETVGGSDNVHVNARVTVQSFAAATLRAGDQIELPAGSAVRAAAGLVLQCGYQ